ncbi:MAG: hydroxyisourate hydrolase [Longimicrobiaceae bacterium]
MSEITTHVLDTARGRPAQGIRVVLERVEEGSAFVLARGLTDADGRLRDLLPDDGPPLEPGTFRLVFDTGRYFAGQGVQTFYPEVAVVFQVRDAGQHHHVPLLLSPFGYTTYRGS